MKSRTQTTKQWHLDTKECTDTEECTWIQKNAPTVVTGDSQYNSAGSFELKIWQLEEALVDAVCRRNDIFHCIEYFKTNQIPVTNDMRFQMSMVRADTTDKVKAKTVYWEATTNKPPGLAGLWKKIAKTERSGHHESNLRCSVVPRHTQLQKLRASGER